MSRGQRPRWPAYFPRMKQRGHGRRRPVRIVVYDAAMRPVWPPVIEVDGRAVRFDEGMLRIGGRAIGPNGWEVTE